MNKFEISTGDNVYLSLYNGSFNQIGLSLCEMTDNFKDFSIISNIPYGKQSIDKAGQNLKKT